MITKKDFIKKILFSDKLIHEDSFIPLQIIFFIAFYIPVEDLISAWLPLPEVGVGITRLIPDLIIYFILFRIIYIRKAHKMGFNKTFIDPLLFAFFLCFCLSVIFNQSDLLASLDHLRTSWRYVAVYYILVNISCSISQTSHFIKLFQRIGILQAVLASFQFFLPATFKMALANGGCDKAILKEASCGSFVDSALLSCFLLIAISLTLTDFFWNYSSNKKITINKVIPVIALYFGLFASKKRAALFFAAFIPVFTLLLFKRKKLLGIYFWVIISLITVIIFILPFLVSEFNLVTRESAEAQVDISSYFLRILSGDYWNEFFLNARGWFIVIIGQTLSKSGSWFGFGPDLSTAVEKMSYVLFKATDIAKLERDQDVFYDAYWFAQLAFYGITGLLLYWSILFLLYKESWAVLNRGILAIDRYLATVFCTLVIVSFIYSFVERLFMLRVFSFYFWLFAGLVANARVNRNVQKTLDVPP
jgi:hypothetical protein